MFRWHSVWHEETCFTKLQTQGWAWRNGCHQFFPVQKISSRIDFFLPALSFIALTKKEQIPWFLSQVQHLYLTMDKKLFKILKHKLIPKRWGWGHGERRGTQLPMWPGWNLRNTYIWNSALVTIMGTEGHTQVGHPDSSYLQLQSPKESVLCIHYGE